MHIGHEGTVVASEPGTDRQSCAFPGICVLPTGRWLCTFRAAPAKLATVGQHVLLTWSDDEGRSWCKPRALCVPPRIEGRPGLFRAAYLTALGGDRLLAVLCWVDHSDPSRPFFNEQTQGLLDSRILLSWSEDGGGRWSSPLLVDTAPFHVPTPITGPVLCLGNGDLACQFELNKPYEDCGVWRHRSVLLYSCDSGRTWPEHAITSGDPANRVFYWDQRPAVLNDGRILDLFWTYDNEAAVYLSIHARLSIDHGRTWSDLWDTGVSGQPAAPVELGDGRVAMVYVHRDGPPVIKLLCSEDGGRSWPAGSGLTIHETGLGSQTRVKGSMQDSWAEMGAFSVGLPATAALPGGDVLVVYYAGPHADRTDIRWSRVRP
ncbi:MAG: exo-alpha-sialidase [Phycisphaerae bacterium]|nr:exo-alpha-sialidase [Phycisphaerae bacterium]